MITQLIRLMRPHQWTKQAIVLLPLLSLGAAFSVQDFLHSLGAAIVFSFAAGAVYIFNDLVDIEFDKRDPIRKLRPLASGQVGKNSAIIFLFFLLAVMVTTTLLLSENFVGCSLVLLTYLSINFTYSQFHLKGHNLLGIAMVSVGFSLRFAFGSIFVSIDLSFWALVLLMELSLFMLAIKRFQLSKRAKIANSLSQPHTDFWLLAAVVFASVFMASFAGFITSPETQLIWGANALLLSTIPIALGMVRFMEIATNATAYSDTDATDIVIRDIPMLILVASFVLVLLIGRLTVSA